MYKLICAGVMLVLGSCGGQRQDSVQPTPGISTDIHDAQTRTPSISPERYQTGGLVAEVYTYKQIAEQLGIPQAFVQLAGNACTLQSRCIPDVRVVGSVFECRINLARTWCPPGRCKDDSLDPDSPEWTQCYEATYSRTCDQLEVAIECEHLRSKSMALSPTAWK